MPSSRGSGETPVEVVFLAIGARNRRPHAVIEMNREYRLVFRPRECGQTLVRVEFGAANEVAHRVIDLFELGEDETDRLPQLPVLSLLLSLLLAASALPVDEKGRSRREETADERADRADQGGTVGTDG